MAMAAAITLRDRTRKKARHSLSGADGDAISTAEFRNSGHRTAKPPCTEYDAAYFQAYSHVGVHEEMIKDCVRTDAYRDAIFQHKDFIAGKVVVDVGCGTGILSIFCAQAGARRVYAVDASNIALQNVHPCFGGGQHNFLLHSSKLCQANEVVKANNLSDTVKVLHGRIEDVEIDDEVDVIVSEWMGYMLLYESMLGSVIAARDRWLKPGGLVLPSNATLYMAAVSHPDRYSGSVDFWRNVYGIDMSAMIPLAKQSAFGEPSVETISSENVLTLPHVVKHVDCHTVTMDELDSVTTKFRFNSTMRASLHGFAFWFDVKFGGPSHTPVTSELGQTKNCLNPNEVPVLSTSPKDHPTHWQQTVVYTYEPTEVEEHEAIEGSVTLSQGKENRRFMNIHLEYTCGGRTVVKESVLC